MSKRDPLLEQLARDLAGGQRRAPRPEDPIGDIEIVAPSDKQTHVIDDGATQQIADFGAVSVSDMPEGIEETGNAGQPLDGGERRDTQDILGLAEGAHENIRGSTREVFRDDFTEHVRRLAVARIGPNGELLDDFDQLSRVQALEYQDLRAAAPFIRSAPPTALDSILGNVGIVRAVVIGGAVPRGQVVELARWAGNDAETQAITVTFGLAGSVPDTAGSGARPVGLVQFGTRGALAQVEIDIGVGCQLVVTGSAVIVSAAMEGTAWVLNGGALIVDGTEFAKSILGMLSFRSTLRTTPVTRSLYMDPLSAAAQTFAVPPFAKSVWFYRNNDASVSVTLEFLDAATNPRYIVTLGTAVNMTNPIPLDGSIINVRVTRTAGADSFASLIFELGL